jgi:hypothetical protein
MQLNLLDRVGDWNPQLFRELKGRLNLRNIAIAVATSLLGQLILLMSWLSQFELRKTYYYDLNSPFCRLRDTYQSSLQNYRELEQQYRQLQQQFAHYSGPKYYDSEKILSLKGKIAEVKTALEQRNMRCPEEAINLQLLWQDHASQMFAWFSVFILFIVLVVGTYMLISDLAGEERRGTLNFIRLSPQSTQSILGGKLLGVPVLLYLAAVLAIPLHLWVGLSAQIPLAEILSFWAVIISSCAFFYSAALLFGLITSWFSGFQAWLGSGGLLFVLTIAHNRGLNGSPADWLNLFCPSVVLPYLVNKGGSGYSGYSGYPFGHGINQDWQWFYFPIGATGLGIVLFALLNYGLWSYWIWQALNRRFHNPNSTILSKRQSYLLTACFAVVNLGFALQASRQGYNLHGFNNFFLLLSVNLLLLVSLIAALSPHRQALQDWARYRHPRKSSLLKDLMVGDKSPAVVAIAINLAIACTPVAIWILFWSDGDNRMQVLSGLLLMLNLVLIYATLTQLMLLMKTNKRALWAAGTVVSASLVPPFILSLLSIYPGKNWGGLWLLTTAPWDALKYTSITLLGQVLFIQWGILAVLSWQLTRQLRQAGESASKALFAERPALPR